MVLHRGVSMVGAGMTRFHNKLHADKTGRELFVEAALDAAGSVDNGFRFRDAGALFVGNFTSDVFEGQGHTAAVMADWLGVNPVPAYRIEDACASSGAALNLGVMAIASGMTDAVIVGGVEKMSRLTTDQVTDALALAADSSYETSVGFTFPAIYAAIASAYFNKYGTGWDQLAAVTIKNHRNGALNPKAQFQSEIASIAQKLGERDGRTFKDEMEFLWSDFNPTIASPLRLFDCCPVSDGGACVILATKEVAARTGRPLVRLAGVGQATDTHCVHEREEPTDLLAVRRAAAQAFAMAGVGPSDVSVAELHDAFTILEIVESEEVGFFKKGQGHLALERGETALTGRIPINPSGGLKGKGHPVGATGVGQAHEIVHQLRGEAGKRQVKDARIGFTCNFGGFGNNVVCLVFVREN